MQLDKRKLLGPLFAPLSRLKHSQTSRMLVAAACMPGQILRARHNRPYFAVDLASPRGLGAVVSEALLMCGYAEQQGLVPVITSSNRLYAAAPGRDFMADYLGPEPTGLVPPTLRPMHFRTLWSFFHLQMPQRLPLMDASRLFWKHFPPKASVCSRVDAILAQLPNARFDMAIHYRGTDKILEAALVDYAVFESAIAKEISGFASNRMHAFLATDDASFEAFIKSRFPQIHFTTYNLGAPSDVSRGRHFSDMRPEDKAIESLVNMFLLAASPVCIRGSSYMSAISKIINPELRTVTLNQTHWGSGEFPEKELLAEEAARTSFPGR